MSNTHIRLTIHRPGKPDQIVTENLDYENAIHLRTFRHLFGELLSRFRSVWVSSGLLAPDCNLASLRKTLFFKQNFQVMELLDEAGDRLGIYCDIASPLVKDKNQYHFTDWFLDVWITAEGAYRVLDEDEFEQANRDGLLSQEEYLDAQASLAFLLAEIESERFPDSWIGE